MTTIYIPEGKYVYFASDQHLGAPSPKESRGRELKFVTWLGQVSPNAAAIFLLGDMFDFWFEYKTVVPKGYTRVLGKLAEITDSGIPVYYFVGNHDLWMNGYFEEELGIPVFHKPQVFQLNDQKFFIGHGDGLGPGDKGYKRMKRVFTNKAAQWLFRWFHPDLGVRLARHLSLKNKLISGKEDLTYHGDDKEWLVQFSKSQLQESHYDYFVFGHRHLPLEIALDDNSSYVNLGDWISHFTYGVYDGTAFTLKSFST